jgi:hypothetical protein
MNRLLSFLAVVGIVAILVTPAAVAQELTADDYIAFWKPVVGSWKTTTEMDGKVLPGAWRARLSANGKCLVTYYEGGHAPSSQSIDGYDPVSKKWTLVGFDAGGAFVLLTIEFADMKPGKTLGKGVIGKHVIHVFDKDGKTTTTTSTMTCTEIDEKQMVFVFSDVKRDGEPKPDWKWALERQPEGRRPPPISKASPATVANALNADDYIELWKPLVGSWKSVLESDGKTTDGTWRTRLSRNQKCFVTYGTGGGYPATQTIDGFDPATKKWTVFGFDADGTFSIDAGQISDMQKGKRVGKGLTCKGEVRRFTKDGKTTTLTYTFTCKELSDNRAVCVWSDRTENGQPKPDETWTGERQPDRTRRPQP